MYRGPRPHRGGYHHPLPPPPSRGFGRHSGVAHHADPDPYRRPSPHRRYPSPGAGRPPRAYGSYSPPSPRSSLPVDHSLVITVGNELTRSSGYTDPEPPYVRDYSAGDSRYRYSPRNSSYDEHSDRGLPRHSISRGRSRGRSRSPSYERSKSRARSRSRSYSRGRSPERAKSRCRSRSRPRRNSYSRSRSRSRSRARSRARSRGRSKSRARSRSSSSGRSHRSSASKKTLKEEDEFSELVKARRRKEIQDMLVKPAKSILKKRLDSSETDSPMLVQNSDSPQANPDGGLSHETEQILSALNRTLDSNLLSSYLGKSGDGSALEELISQIQSAKESGGDFALAHQKGSEEKAGLTQLHGRMFQPPNIKKRLADIEDEERFLYGEDNEEKKVTKEIPMSSAFLDTQFPKSQDFQTEPATASYTLGHFGDSSHPHNPYSVADVDSKEDTSEFPSGVKPKDADARNDVEDYEKIQDLLKTIGLDLGVAEISKMAARTQERLHGNISAKTLARRPASRKCRSNSGSSSRSSSRSRSSSNSSSGSSRSRKKAISSEPRTSTSQNNSKVDSQPDKAASSWSTPSTTPTPVTQPFPPPPNLPPMPPFHQPPPRGVMPQDFSSCGFGNYGNYVPYMPPGWPMYPPPALPVPPPSQMNPYNQTNVNRPFTKGIGSREGKSGKASSLDTEASSVMSSSQRRMSDDMNTASQKQKVTEELEKLKKDKELRLKRKDRLLLELETLRKQHGELLRKKRREKDGHKDPILLELGKIQDNIMGQISCLRSEQKEEDQKHEELVKVALILGIDYKETKTHDEHMPPPPLSRKELVRSPERVSRNSKASSMKPRSSPERVRRSPPKSRSVDTYTEQFEYYDAGNHWCKNCNVTSGSMFDYFMHLHSKTHRKTLDPYYRPWAKFEDEKKSSAGERISKPSKGSEFLIPVRGFFCQLCAEFFGDPVCAEAHVTCHVHNERYKKKMYDNPLYEQRRNLDRQAGLETLKNLEHKRKRKDSDTAEVKKSKQKFCDEAEDKLPYSKEESKKIKESESKLKEDYFKYKKEDKDKQNYKKENVDTYKVKKEDETVVHKKEEQRIRYSMDEDDSYKFKKEGSRYDNDRYRNKDNDDDDDSNDKKKYHYRGDDDKHRFRKKDDGTRSFREDEEPKYGKDLFKRQKNYRGVGKMSRCKEEDSDSEDERESRGGYEKDGKTKKDSTEKMISKEKPSEPPKILCGPSPALLAKLRKKNVEAPVRPGTGKVFKKAQKTALEKEAERIAAQFIKEDEESLFFKSEGSNDAAKDPFSKSIAAAKSIAMKLSTKGNLTPSDQWLAYNENKSSPTLPPSSSPVLVRKSYTGAQNKSVLPSTDKSSSVDPTSKEDNQINVTPESSAGSIQKPVLLPTCSSTPEIQQQKQLDSKIQPQAKSTPELQQQKQPNPEIQHQKQPNPEIQLQTESTSEIQQEKEPNPKIQPQTELTQNIQQQEELTPTSVPEKTNPIQMNPVASNECVFTLESDVPAPGVPEEEQMLTVVIRPPPTLLSKPKNPLPKSGKPKTLAAGKAKDLFNIFYSGSTTVKPSIISGDKKASLSTPPDTSRNKCSDSKDSNEENHDRPVAEDKEPLKNDCLEVLEDSTSVVAIKGNDQEVVQPEESVKDQESVQQEESEQQEESKDSIVQHEDHFKSEDTCVVSDEKPLECEDWNVQTEESIMTEDSKATRGEESPKNSFSNSYQNEDIFEMTPPIIIFESCESNVGEGQESLMVEDTGNLDKFGETQVDEMTKQQLFETSETSEVDDLIMKEKKLETMQANDGEMLLESEEPMSFSPIPGSFTEQLNLDTFDFSFEPL